MGTLVISAVPALQYTGTRGSGQALAQGSHVCHIAAIRLTNDSINNPFSDEENEPKETMYDDCRVVVAVKFTNPTGGVTERYHFEGFIKYKDLSQAQKEEKSRDGKSLRYIHDLASGYALEDLYGADGKKIGVPSGELKADGSPKLRATLTRVVDPAKSAIAQRIFMDLLVSCHIPAQDNLSPEQAVAQLEKFTDAVGIKVKHEEYQDKTRARVVATYAVGTAVATTAAAAEDAIPEDSEF
jgi:hypothetical protein